MTKTIVIRPTRTLRPVLGVKPRVAVERDPRQMELNIEGATAC